MKILARVLALFLIMPVVELALLVQVDKLIGFWPTIGIILFTGVLGGYLAKREGLAVWRQFNARMNSGDLPGKQVVDGIIILCAGALLITPGVLTDFLGFIGLFPFTRAIVRKQVMKRVDRALKRGTFGMSFGAFEGGAFEGGAFAGPAGPDGPPRTAPAEPEADYWHGTAEEVPRHARDPETPPPSPNG